MKNTIIKYLEGNLPEKKQQELLDWIRKEDNQTTFNSIKEEWWKSNQQNGSDLITVRFSERLSDKQQLAKTKRINQFYKYAAAVLLLISIGSTILWTHSVVKTPELTFTEVKTENGQMSNIVLPDSTEVWINSGTQLVYNNQYGIKNRDIKVNGEAFFSVTKNRTVPFIVNIGELKVEVTGTQFGVSNYADAGNMNVVLEEGSVNVLGTNDQLLMTLSPNHMASYNKTARTIEKVKVVTAHYTSWRNGIMHVFELPLEQLIMKLEKRYNQQFSVDPEIADLPFTFSIEKESLPEVLKLLERISPIKAEQDGAIIKLKYKP